MHKCCITHLWLPRIWRLVKQLYEYQMFPSLLFLNLIELCQRSQSCEPCAMICCQSPTRMSSLWVIHWPAGPACARSAVFTQQLVDTTWRLQWITLGKHTAYRNTQRLTQWRIHTPTDTEKAPGQTETSSICQNTEHQCRRRNHREMTTWRAMDVMRDDGDGMPVCPMTEKQIISRIERREPAVWLLLDHTGRICVCQEPCWAPQGVTQENMWMEERRGRREE